MRNTCTYKLLSVFIVLLTMAPFSLAQRKHDKVVEQIIEIAKTDNRTMEYVDILSNRFGGRPVGSDAYENAADWAEYMFKQWGLDVWKQEAGEVPVGFNRGPWFGKMLSEDGMILHFATPSYTVGTKGVQRGHVLKEPQTRAEFERMKGALKGAWVLIGGTNDGWPIDWSEAGDEQRAEIIAQNEEISKQNMEIRRYNSSLSADETPKEYLPMKSAPALFYKEMVEAGILGIIQSSAVPIRALYDRKNIDKMSFDSLPPVPDIKLDEEQYKIIAAKVDRRDYFLLEFDIRNHFKMGPVKYHNVIGVMEGTKYPDEYVLVGGHLDTYDVATGGVDNTSGVAPTMEAARLIAEAGGQPERTILFCLWAAEEFGLLGSKAFVEKKTIPMDKISNYFNRDYAPTVPVGITVPAAMYEDFVEICEPIAGINPDFPFVVTKSTAAPRPLPTTASGSDHAYFAMNGVPTIGFNIQDYKGYNFDYGEIWHTERDLYNKSIPEYEDHTSIVTAITVYGVANLDHLLDRTGIYID